MSQRYALVPYLLCKHPHKIALLSSLAELSPEASMQPVLQYVQHHDVDMQQWSLCVLSGLLDACSRSGHVVVVCQKPMGGGANQPSVRRSTLLSRHRDTPFRTCRWCA
jgi:hypothetical protein